MARDRGIEHADRQFDLIKLINDKLKHKRKIRILDAGCGHGVAMIEIAKKFGDKVEIHGFLDNPAVGNPKIIREEFLQLLWLCHQFCKLLLFFSLSKQSLNEYCLTLQILLVLSENSMPH